VTAPDPSKDLRPVQAEPVAAWPGAPLEPTGNPLLDGVGPAAYVARANHPEHTIDGLPMIVPMRVATDFSVAKRDPDPRGMEVVGADGKSAGVVRDLWVDRAEPQVRYLQVEVPTATGSRHVLVPMTLARVDTWRRHVKVKSLLGAQFADAPGLSNPDQVTLAEEDRITAYFAGGTLYAEPSRLGPWL
jgi:photosynthetic reaction center H subunit